jgi:hypothetical protein
MASKDTDFPNLRSSHWQQISDPDLNYNCIAFAVGRTDVCWWPDNSPGNDTDYWPDGIPREEAIDAFVTLFGSMGFEECTGDRLENGYERIAIYAKAGEPTHAACQLAGGAWASKLGRQDDIRHDTLAALSGPCYGVPVRFMRRARQSGRRGCLTLLATPIRYLWRRR